MESNQILDLNITDESNSKVEIEIVDGMKVLILSLVSFGLYGIWWIYKSWRFFKEKDGLDIMPVARAIFSIFFLYSLFENIQHYAKSNGYQKSYSSWALFAGQIIFSIASRLPEPYWLISIVSSFFLLAPANALNFAIANSEQYKATTISGFNGRQIAVLVIGGIFWILVLAGLFLAPETQY
ncbi:hypothetical protein ACFQ21_03515 [Ohtaekwangia kribbensis]|jgi:uncharacterized membrane protein|uniref:DUF4234 domain-containing protein n=1 Tax=Ohtaekwangia kribbensis TaxID=688913 RepID=A0ABW3JYX5_9BACT